MAMAMAMTINYHISPYCLLATLQTCREAAEKIELLNVRLMTVLRRWMMNGDDEDEDSLGLKEPLDYCSTKRRANVRHPDG